ncbi:MAG TPA: DUF1684 domain-containing protein, partial [Bryobacteraceae bacterium]
AVPAADAYKSEIEEWRAKREAELKSDTGWLTVAGLFWLHEGDNRAGTDPQASIVLPTGAKSIGSFQFVKGKVTFVRAPGAAVSLNGNPVNGSAHLQSDEDGAKADVLEYQDITMFVIKRGTRSAVRMRDKNSKMRREFSGEHWFPVREDMRFEAKFVSYPEPKMVPIPNILNEVEQEKSIGYATFTYQGHEYTLEPVIEEDHLFYIFKDQTAGKETYGAGRFLYSEMPQNGHVILDFNQAVNPPCSFTPFATCPLPPKQNRLAVRIEAGELKYGDH